MKLFLSILLFHMITSQAIAIQSLTVTNSWVIKGTIVSNDHHPAQFLPGISIVIQGSIKGTVTDINGQFELEITDEDFGTSKELTIVIHVACFQSLYKVVKKQNIDLGTIVLTSSNITILGTANDGIPYSSHQSTTKKLWASIKGFPRWITKSFRKH